jgi:thioredoxin-related protein
MIRNLRERPSLRLRAPLVWGLLWLAVAALSTAASPAPRATQASIFWITLDDAMRLAPINNKKIFVYVSTSWCTWCKLFDKKVLDQEDVIHYINDNFFPVKMDAWSQAPMSFKGSDYGPRADGNGHELAYQLLKGNLQFPAVLIMNEKAEVITPIHGYVERPTFETLLRFYATNAYLKTKWSEYQQEQAASN